jgi:hypothetical protein
MALPERPFLVPVVSAAKGALDFYRGSLLNWFGPLMVFLMAALFAIAFLSWLIVCAAVHFESITLYDPEAGWSGILSEPMVQWEWYRSIQHGMVLMLAPCAHYLFVDRTIRHSGVVNVFKSSRTGIVFILWMSLEVLRIRMEHVVGMGNAMDLFPYMDGGVDYNDPRRILSDWVRAASVRVFEFVPYILACVVLLKDRFTLKLLGARNMRNALLAVVAMAFAWQACFWEAQSIWQDLVASPVNRLFRSGAMAVVIGGMASLAILAFATPLWAAIVWFPMRPWMASAPEELSEPTI